MRQAGVVQEFDSRAGLGEAAALGLALWRGRRARLLGVLSVQRGGSLAGLLCSGGSGEAYVHIGVGCCSRLGERLGGVADLCHDRLIAGEHCRLLAATAGTPDPQVLGHHVGAEHDRDRANLGDDRLDVREQ